MTFFSKKLINVLSLGALLTIVSCGSDTSNDERQRLALQMKSSANENSPITVNRFSVEGTSVDKESEKSRFPKSKTHHVKACLSSNIGKNLSGLYFNIAGIGFDSVTKRADESGCIKWDETFDMNYSLSQRYIPLKRKITLSGKTAISYDLNLGYNQYNNTFLHSNDYQVTKKSYKASLNNDEIINIKNIKFTPKGFGKIDPRNDNLIIDKKVVVSACFSLSTNGKPLSNELVDAKLVNLEKLQNNEDHAVTEMVIAGAQIRGEEDGRLNESGCGEFKFFLKHERYTNTRRIPFNIEVNVRNEVLKNAKITKGICLYPWTNNGWIFAEVAPGKTCEEDNNNTQARLFVDEVRYNFLGHDNQNGFHLNNNLDLVIEKSFIVTMLPKVHYGNLVDKMNPYEPFYQGKLKLEVYFLAPLEGDIDLTNDNKHKWKLISVASRIVDVENNLLKARIDMPVKFTDMPYIHTRTFAAIKLSPIVEDEKDRKYAPLPAWAAGTFHASSKTFQSILHTQLKVTDTFSERDYTKSKITEKMSEMVQLENYLESMSKSVANATTEDIINAKLQPRSTKSSEALFSEELKTHKDFDNAVNLTDVQMNAKLENKLTDKELGGKTGLYQDNYTAETLKKMCGLFFSEEKMGMIWKTYKDYDLKKCHERPWDYMMITPLSHIQKIVSKPIVKHSNTIRIYKSSSTGNYFNEQTRVGWGKSLKGGVGAKLDFKLPFSEASPVGGGVGISGGIDYSTSFSLDRSNGESNRSDNGESIDLYAEAITLKFDAITKQCVMIEGTFKSKRIRKGRSFTRINVNNPKRFKICKQRAGKENLEETWYFTGEGYQFNSILRDRLGMMENQYTILFRGKKTMYKFTEFLTQASSGMFNIKQRNQQTPDTYMLAAYADYKEAFDNNNDYIDDSAIPGTIEKFDPVHNGSDHNFSEDDCEVPPSTDNFDANPFDFCLTP